MDSKYSGFLDYARQSVSRGEKIMESLAPHVALKNKKILDCGCGDGGVAVAFARAGCTVTAIDKNPKSLALARQKLDRENLKITLLQKNAEEMDFEEASFDGALLVDFLEYTLKPDEVLLRLNRALKPGAFCYIAVLNRFFWFNKKFRHPLHRRFYFWNEISGLLKSHGFEFQLLRKDQFGKLENPGSIETAWKRNTALLLNRIGGQKLLGLWVKSPWSPWFDVYWKIIARKNGYADSDR